ncbi:MAG: dihydropteroate synthase [Phycisphaerales bacterium]
MNACTWKLAHGRELDLGQPRVVGILNITPDSFADGGSYNTTDLALQRATQCAQDGVAMLDIGGESTRPGAQRVSADEQIARVIPVIEAVRAALPGIAISVDTTRAEVALRAIEAGADAINDVSGAEEDDAMLEVAAETGAGLILMHRLAPPDEDSFSDRYESAPKYADVVATVRDFLSARSAAAVRAGVHASSIAIDPGLGFGKSVEQNIELIRRTGELCSLGYPVMSAASRKSFVGRVGLERDSDPSERLGASLAVTVLHAQQGALLFRVHDVPEHVQALRVHAAVGTHG